MLRLQFEILKPVWLPLSTEPLDSASLVKLVDNCSQPIPINSATVNGSVAANGSPAIGWGAKLQVDDQGLWVYAKFLTSEDQSAAEEEQLLLSGIVDQHALDPTTGKSIGPKLLTIQAFPVTSTKTESESSLMNTITAQEQATILQRLPDHLKTALTRPLAIQACVVKHVPGAAKLSYDECWKRYVHPVNAALALQEFEEKAKTTPARLTVSGSNAPTQSSRVQLDVRAQPGRNKFEKLINHLTAGSPGALTWEEAHRRAAELNRTHTVIA